MEYLLVQYSRRRIDLAAELYHEELFEQRTFDHLRTSGRPYLIINATNLETGSQFDFTRLHFDAIGSDLEAFPIARAVAASSAFPFLLSPISLVNYPPPADYQPPGWYEGGLEALHIERRRYQVAKDLAYYLETQDQGKAHPYIHLMDGGLADNIGARAVQDAFTRGFIREKINNNDVSRLVIIVVNAATDPSEQLSQRESPPHLPTVAYKTATVSMDNYSFETISLMVESLKQRLQAQKDLEACQKLLARACPSAPAVPTLGRTIDPYVMEVNFLGASQLEGEDPTYYLNLPTSFRLDPEQVDRLVRIGPKLLKALPQYQCLLAVLRAEAKEEPRPERCPIGSGISGP